MNALTEEVKEFIWKDIEERYESNDTETRDKAFVDAMNFIGKCNDSDKVMLAKKRFKLDAVKVGIFGVGIVAGLIIEQTGSINFFTVRNLIQKLKV